MYVMGICNFTFFVFLYPFFLPQEKDEERRDALRALDKEWLEKMEGKEREIEKIRQMYLSLEQDVEGASQSFVDERNKVHAITYAYICVCL